jgi:hypothetical protein
LNQAAQLWDEVFRLATTAQQIAPPDVPFDIAALGTYVLTRDLISVITQVARQQGQALTRIGNQLEEIAKFLFQVKLEPTEPETIAQKAKKRGIEVLPDPPAET